MNNTNFRQGLPADIIYNKQAVILDYIDDKKEILGILTASKGHFLDSNRLKLSEISAVIRFESKFQNPFLKEFDGDNSQVA